MVFSTRFIHVLLIIPILISVAYCFFYLSTAYKFNTLPRLGKKKKTPKVKESKDDISTDLPKSQRKSAFEMTRRKLSRGSKDHTPSSFDFTSPSHKQSRASKVRCV